MAVRSENSLNSLRAAVFSALDGNVSYGGNTINVYDRVPPGTAYPYVRIGPGIDTPADSHSTPGTSTDFVIEVFSAYEGFKEANGIMHAVDVLLDRVGTPPSFSVTSYRTVWLRRLSTQELEDDTPEGVPITRVIGRYQARLEEN